MSVLYQYFITISHAEMKGDTTNIILKKIFIFFGVTSVVCIGNSYMLHIYKIVDWK